MRLYIYASTHHPDGASRPPPRAPGCGTKPSAALECARRRGGGTHAIAPALTRTCAHVDSHGRTDTAGTSTCGARCTRSCALPCAHLGCRPYSVSASRGAQPVLHLLPSSCLAAHAHVRLCRSLNASTCAAHATAHTIVRTPLCSPRVPSMQCECLPRGPVSTA